MIPVSKISTFGAQLVERRRVAVDRPALLSGPGAGTLPSTGSPSTFQTRPRVMSPTGTEIGAAGVHDCRAAGEAIGRVHRDRADAVVAQVLLHLGDQHAALGALDPERGVDLRELLGEHGVDHDALDLDQAADVLGAAVALGHVSPTWKLAGRRWRGTPEGRPPRIQSIGGRVPRTTEPSAAPTAGRASARPERGRGRTPAAPGCRRIRSCSAARLRSAGSTATASIAASAAIRARAPPRIVARARRLAQAGVTTTTAREGSTGGASRRRPVNAPISRLEDWQRSQRRRWRARAASSRRPSSPSSSSEIHWAARSQAVVLRQRVMAPVETPIERRS